jgi:hypothetical protein
LASRKLYSGDGETKDVTVFIIDEVTIGGNILPATSYAPKTCYALVRKKKREAKPPDSSSPEMAARRSAHYVGARFGEVRTVESKRLGATPSTG